MVSVRHSWALLASIADETDVGGVGDGTDFGDETDTVLGLRPDEASPAGSSGKPFLPDRDGPGVTPALETGAPRVLG